MHANTPDFDFSADIDTSLHIFDMYAAKFYVFSNGQNWEKVFGFLSKSQ